MQLRREWGTVHLTIVILSSMFFILANQASAGNKLRGIDPQDLAYYQADIIWCKDGSKAFPRERLNDNFCDCADGTDEPGTSACPNGNFYCKKIGSAPKLVYASRVNDGICGQFLRDGICGQFLRDGICDCCDGSDEYERRVDCANTCGGAIQELSGILGDDFGQLKNSDADDDDLDASPVQPQKQFGEDLGSKLKDVKAVMLVMQWLPLFSLLSLLGWMWAQVRRRPQFRQRTVSRSSLV